MTALPAGAVRLEGVGKRYTKYEDTPTLVYGLLHALKRGRRGKLWAVQDLDLSLEPGEAVGVIGRNGSGKSTLLQMMCGVTGPTAGRVRVGGRIAPLISVGVGFHPELTGRENIYVNGTILGLTRQQIAQRLDEIIAFSEIEAFIDTPVKFYSSGMFVRLGFSVAAHVDPDVLLLDEVLAVGDISFQMKCYRHLAALRDTGCTVVMVSHHLAALEQHCTRGVVLSDSRMVFDGAIGDAVGAYFERLGEEPRNGPLSDGPSMDPDALEVLSVRTLDSLGHPASRFATGASIAVEVQVRALRAITAPFIGVGILSDAGAVLYRENNMLAPYPSLMPGESATYVARLHAHLTTGAYNVECVVGRGNEDSREAERVASGAALVAKPFRLKIYIAGRELIQGTVDLSADFSTDSQNSRDK